MFEQAGTYYVVSGILRSTTWYDWVVAERQNFIPLVNAAVTIADDGLGDPEIIGYSGTTYVAIWSGKHASSTAYSHE